MKKTLAIITTLLLVISLFSNVALAEAAQAKVTLDNEENITYSSSFNTVTLTGKIIDNTTSALINTNNTIKIVKDVNNNGVLDTDEIDSNIVNTVEANGGQYSVVITPNDIGRFFIYGALIIVHCFIHCECLSRVVCGMPSCIFLHSWLVARHC